MKNMDHAKREFRPGDLVAIRMPMADYSPTKAGDMLEVIKTNHFSSVVEELRTLERFEVENLDLDKW